MSQFDLISGLFECITNILLVEKKAVERVSESYDSIIFNFILLLDANHMLRASFLEYLTYKLWVAGGHDHEL